MHLNSDKNNKNFESSTQNDIVSITFCELIPEEKEHENDSENLSDLQNEIFCGLWWINFWWTVPYAEIGASFQQ